MKKILRYAVAVTVLSLGLSGLTGCSSILNPGGEDTITVYSNSLSDGRDVWLKEQAEKAGFKVELVSLGGGDVYNRLVAEKSNPIADVTFGLNDVYFQKLVKQGILEAYTPKWADKIDPASVDKSKEFWPIVREPIMMVCNTAAYDAAAMPKEWSDLWTKPQYDKKYEFASSLGGATTQIVLSSILSRYIDPNGKLGVSQEGWDQIKAYYAHGVRSVQGTDLYARMKSGDVNCGQMWLAGKVTREKQYGIKTEAIHPSDGVPMVRQSVALVKGTKKAEQAKKFIDWFGSAEVQGAWSKQFATAPTNKDAVAEGNQDAIKFTDSFKEQKIDWAYVADHLDKWIEEIQLNYLK